MVAAPPNASTGLEISSTYELREDKISQLPDDVLASILSWLTLKEAILTGLLAMRWRYLWTHVTHLNFHLSRKETNDKKYRGHLSQNEKLRHVNQVNRVLDLHKSYFLEKFRIALPLDHEDYHCDLDKWIKFALSRKVQALEIDLTEPSGRRRYHGIQYTLPLNWTSNSSFSASFLNALKSLSLKFVGVDDQMAKLFLSSCPMLEHLSIQGSSQLKNLQIIGPSLKLKKLEICDILKISIKLCNVEYLESFTCRNTCCAEWVLENIPSLLHIDVEPLSMCNGVPDFITRMSQCLNQLVELNLKIPQRDVELGLQCYYRKFPKMEKLRVLKLNVLSPSEYYSLLGIAALLDASPYLHKFVIQIEGAAHKPEKLWFKTIFQYGCCHANEHLKTVKFGGYSHRLSEFEFAVHLLRCAVALEEFIVDTRTSKDRNQSHAKHVRDITAHTRRELERVAPQGVKLLIF